MLVLWTCKKFEYVDSAKWLCWSSLQIRRKHLMTLGAKWLLVQGQIKPVIKDKRWRDLS